MHVRAFWRHAALLAGGILALSGCAPKEHDVVVASVANEPITLSEYERQYLRNTPNRDSAAALPLEARQRFLDLMVNYKLKLADARRQNLEQQPAVRNEIRQYKGGLAASFVTDREIVAPALRRLYERRGEEIRASHILLTLAPNAPAADSAAAYTRAAGIIEELTRGASFDSLARQTSQDPSVQQNGGDLYYFSAGMMMPEFENAVYAMKQGQVSTIRTPYGLHVVKVTDRRASRGEIRASHIMIRFASMTPTPEDTAAAWAKVTAIRDSLTRGADFAALAMRNSGDPGSAPQGGDLGWFGRRRWVIAFDEAVFTLPVGQVSAPIRSPYGYHIIKCTDQRARKSYEESRQELQQIYQQTRYQVEMPAYQARLRRDMGLVRNDGPILDFLSRSDSTKTTRDSAWTSALTPELGRAVVFSARGQQQMRLDSLVSAIEQRTDLPPSLLRWENFRAPVEKMEEQFLWASAADSFARLYPEFASILAEYRDGVLLYQMEQEHVWNRVSPSDSVLRLFHAQNQDRFVWPDRVEFTEIRMATERTASKVANLLKAGKSIEELAVEDSIRMAQPAQFTVLFRPRSAALTSDIMKTLAAAAAQVKQEPTMSIQLVAANSDTAQGMARRRLEAMKKYLVANLKMDSMHVSVVNRPGTSSEERDRPGNTRAAAEAQRRLQVLILGRQPLLLAKPETSLLAVHADERAARADSLAPGTVSSPFQHRGLYLVVRMNKREPSRQKSFEEAQGEISSAYQDAESKRLEQQWIRELHSRFPVVVNTETLRGAFAPVRQQ